MAGQAAFARDPFCSLRGCNPFAWGMAIGEPQAARKVVM
jgi:hypothetical protein